MDMLVAQLRCGNRAGIAAWNDAKDRTAEDVLQVLGRVKQAYLNAYRGQTPATRGR